MYVYIEQLAIYTQQKEQIHNRGTPVNYHFSNRDIIKLAKL